MGDQNTLPGDNGKPASPFPSRKDVHGSRIPQVVKAAPVTGEGPKGPTLRDSIVPRRAATDPAHLHQLAANVPVQPAQDQLAVDAPVRPAKVQPVAPVPPRRSELRTQAAAPPSSVPPLDTTELKSIAVKQSKRRKRRRTVRTTLILLVLVGLIAAAVWFAISSLQGGSDQAELDDYPGPGTGSAEVTIDPGEHGADIALKLYEADVVKSEAAFIRAFNNNSAAATIRPGTYSLKLQMSAAGALAAMLDETNRRDNAVTVNAGQTVSQVRERLVEIGGFTEEEVDAALADPEAIGLPVVADGNPEGWLAAGSYEVGAADSAQTILAQMITRQVQTLTDLNVPEDQWMDVLTKASILEREAGNPEDLAKVARVISNRLEFPDAETRGMLQMDSTALYGVGKSGGIPTLEDLKNDNPYNTYIVKGLPAGPIATPSVAAIEATLNPAEGSWLYFVTVNLDTGETLFVDTLAEQEANIELLKQWCSANEDRC